MSDLTLTLLFNGSVRMGTGYAGKGIDEVIDEFAPLSSGGIKGVIRDEARILFPPNLDQDGKFVRDHLFVQAVFGDRFGRHCPWNFDVVPGPATVKPRASLQLDKYGSVVEGALLVKEEAWFDTAQLDIYQRTQLTKDGAPASWDIQKIRDAHLALIATAARLVDKIGQRKTRGMGWVAFSSDSSVRDVKADLDLIEQIRKEYSNG